MRTFVFLITAPLFSLLAVACSNPKAPMYGSTSDTLVGSVFGPTGQATYRYRFTLNGCDTGAHQFSTLTEYCQALTDPALNHSCASGRRKREFQRVCLPSQRQIAHAAFDTIVAVNADSAHFDGRGVLFQGEPIVACTVAESQATRDQACYRSADMVCQRFGFKKSTAATFATDYQLRQKGVMASSFVQAWEPYSENGQALLRNLTNDGTEQALTALLIESLTCSDL